MTLVERQPDLAKKSTFAVSLAGAKAGDEKAFAQLWRAHQPSLVRFLSGLASADDARDVASSVWLEVVRKLDQFEGVEAGFRSWIFTIARSRLTDLRRSRSRRISPVPLETELTDQAIDKLDPAEIIGTDDATRGAIAFISQLPEKQAEVLLLRVVADLDVDAIAELLGKRPGAVRVLSHRGLKRLAELISESEVTK